MAKIIVHICYCRVMDSAAVLTLIMELECVFLKEYHLLLLLLTIRESFVLKSLSCNIAHTDKAVLITRIVWMLTGQWRLEEINTIVHAITRSKYSILIAIIADWLKVFPEQYLYNLRLSFASHQHVERCNY